jgi:hypothetical protein
MDVDAVAESPDPHAMLLAELADFVTRRSTKTAKAGAGCAWLPW